MIDVAVIGSGLAGLACARRLARAGLAPVIFDKGRGPGGRVATRRADGLQFDHGAQHVTARDPGFAALLDDLVAAGAAAVWQDGSGRQRIVGQPGMNALAKALAGGLDLRQAAEVTALHRGPGGWQIDVGGTEHLAARVVITAPAPQAARLLGTGHDLAARLATVRFDPCLTLMAAIAAPAAFVSRSAPDEPLAWIAQDSSKPGRPAGEAIAWVAQAGAGFSHRHLGDDPDALVAAMLPLLCDRLGVSADRVRFAVAHRWRFARVTEPLGQPFLAAADGRLYLAGDWCLGPRVEAAWCSGTAAAEDLLGRMA